MKDCSTKTLVPGAKFFHEAINPHYDARYYKGKVDREVLHEILLKLLRDFVDVCDQLEIKPILMHGGLIGWHWSRRMLPWDDDLDLCLLYEDMVKLDAAASGEDLYDSRFYLLEVNPNYVSRESRNRHFHDQIEPNRIDGRFIHTPTGLFIDLTALAPSGEGVLSTKCPHHYREEDLFPLHRTEIEGFPIFVPHRVDLVLEQEYGPRSTREPSHGRWKFNGLSRSWEPG